MPNSESKDMKGSGMHWYCAGCNRVAKNILTKFGGIQDNQDHLEGELWEVRKELKTMNKAVEGMHKIVEELRKNTDKAYAEVLEGVQQAVKGIMGDLQIAKDRTYVDCLKTNASIDLKDGKTQDIQQKRKMQGQVY